MGSDEQRLMSGEAWRDFCGRLEAVGDGILAEGFPAGPGDRAEGFRWLTRLVAHAIADGDRGRRTPRIRCSCATRRHTTSGAVRIPTSPTCGPTSIPSATYRIWADVSGVRQVIFSLNEGEMQLGEFGVFSERSLDDLEVGDDGLLEIRLSPQEQPGNWLPTHPDGRLFTVRIFQSDWERDAAPSLPHRARRGRGDPVRRSSTPNSSPGRSTGRRPGSSGPRRSGTTTRPRDGIAPARTSPTPADAGRRAAPTTSSTAAASGSSTTDQALVHGVRRARRRLLGVHDPHPGLARVRRFRRAPDQPERRPGPHRRRRPGPDRARARAIRARPTGSTSTAGPEGCSSTAGCGRGTTRCPSRVAVVPLRASALPQLSARPSRRSTPAERRRIALAPAAKAALEPVPLTVSWTPPTRPVLGRAPDRPRRCRRRSRAPRLARPEDHARRGAASTGLADFGDDAWRAHYDVLVSVAGGGVAISTWWVGSWFAPRSSRRCATGSGWQSSGAAVPRSWTRRSTSPSSSWAVPGRVPRSSTS